MNDNVGLLDMSAFAKCRIKGPRAEEFLDNLVANKLPKKIGRINLCHALNTKGGVHSEFTIMREAEESFYLVSAGAFQRLDHDWIYKWMPKDGSVQFENLTNSIGVLDLKANASVDCKGTVIDSKLDKGLGSSSYCFNSKRNSKNWNSIYLQ